VGIKGADFKDEFVLQGTAVDVHVFFGMVGEIKMPGDWFECVFLIFLNIA